MLEVEAASAARYSPVPGREIQYEDVKAESSACLGVRHTQAAILFFSLAVAIAMRVHLSVTIVAMTKTPEAINANVLCKSESNAIGYYRDKEDSNSNFTEISPENNINLKDCIHDEVPKRNKKWGVNMNYSWNKATEELIMFAFFVGYTSANLPMGLVAQRFGWKKPICLALFSNGVLCILTPWITTVGDWWAISTVRLVQGLTQAAFYPSIHSMLGKWAPLRERGRISSYIYTGSQFGTVFSFQISGLLAGSPMFGWPSTFLVLGALSLVCLVLVVCLGADTPHSHPTITRGELLLISGTGTTAPPIRRNTPWRSILSSRAVWSAMLAACGSAVLYLTLLTQIPLYMDNILHVNIKNNGLLSSLPYLFMYITGILFGIVTDFLTRRRYVTVVNIRRINNTIGNVGSGLVLLGFGFVSNTYWAVALLVLSLGLHSGVHLGFQINYIDLAPEFAGPMMALGNTLANLVSLCIPVLVSTIIQEDMSNPHRWQILFGIIVGIAMITNIVFVIFAKGEAQPWNHKLDATGERDKMMELNVRNQQNEKEKTAVVK